jgi:hypothetical protein
MAPVRPAAAALALALLAAAPAAAQTALDRLPGTYVGVGTIADPDGRIVERRDMDVIITRPRRDALFIDTISVTLVDGRRDLAGVIRRAGQTRLQEQRAGFWVEQATGGPFRTRDEITPMAGDPIRWALVDAQGLSVYSFVVLEDGRFELQRIDRRPDELGMTLEFMRIVDGQVVRTGDGRLVRVDQ